MLEIELPNGLKKLGSYAFKECTSLKTAILPGSLESIPKGAFGECTSLSKVTIGDGVESLRENCFRYTALEELVVPSTVTEIEWDALYGCADEHVFNLYVMGIDTHLSIQSFSGFHIWGQLSDDVKENAIVHGYPQSSAARYCADKGIKFEVIDS